MKHETRTFYELAVQRAAESVLRSLDEAIDLEQLARDAALSTFHFHRIFRGLMGETPLELHRRLRMERAAFRLRDENASVTTIALEAGYDTHEAFTRAFRSRYSCSPSEFRNSREVERSECVRPFQIEIASHSGIHFRPQRSALDNAYFIRTEPGAPAMNVEIKEMPELRCAALRHIGPYNRISMAFGQLGELVAGAGLFKAKPTMLAIYYDDPEITPEPELRSDAAVVVPESALIPRGLVEQRLVAGRYACTTHLGPYERIGDTWARFMGRWLPLSGQRIGSGFSYEIYLNTPMEAPKNELLTELYIPLA